MLDLTTRVSRLISVVPAGRWDCCRACLQTRPGKWQYEGALDGAFLGDQRTDESGFYGGRDGEKAIYEAFCEIISEKAAGDLYTGFAKALESEKIG